MPSSRAGRAGSCSTPRCKKKPNAASSLNWNCVSLQGVMDLAPDFDTCGWFSRDIVTFARVGDVLLGADTCTLPDAPQVLLAVDVLDLLSPRVQQVFAGTLERLSPVLGTLREVTTAAPSFDALYRAFRHIQGYQAWQQHGACIEQYGLQLGSGVADRFSWSRTVTIAQMQEYSAIRASFVAHFAALLGSDKVMVLPSMPDIAPLLTESEAALENYRNQAIRMLCLSGLSGLPQISLPLMTIEGAPLGFSVIGPAGSDQSLIAFARTLMEA
jgi:amidase